MVIKFQQGRLIQSGTQKQKRRKDWADTKIEVLYDGIKYALVLLVYHFPAPIFALLILLDDFYTCDKLARVLHL